MKEKGMSKGEFNSVAQANGAYFRPGKTSCILLPHLPDIRLISKSGLFSITDNRCLNHLRVFQHLLKFIFLCNVLNERKRTNDAEKFRQEILERIVMMRKISGQDK